MTSLDSYIESNKDRFLNELLDLLRIPSVSADPKYKADPKHKENDAMKRTVSPDEYLKYAQKWKSMGVRLIGGCCGTNPLYIAKLTSLKKK